MSEALQFRKVLPALQTSIVFAFGGWGLWTRNAILNRPFWGSSTGWETTAVFHVWPWPLKFAVILDMPVVLAGYFLSIPLNYLRPGLPEWVASLPILVLTPLFWYWCGVWADGHVSAGTTFLTARSGWTLLSFFVLLCSAASLVSGYLAGHGGYLIFAVAIWLAVGAAAKVFAVLTNNGGKTS
jgi:hypothetical protein